ncbi:MAG: rhodanese-like domain-containing protein [Myxococcales bacterium]|nr:rhodanese-like domain-containing protein [Myxococcales bacterium]
MTKHALLFVGLSLLAGCNKTTTEAHSAPATLPAQEENLSTDKAKALLSPDASGQLQVQLIDVRTQSERERGFIAGSKHIPIGEIEARMGEIDKSKTVVLYCAAGGRSHQALEILKAAGYRDVRHIADGISGWKAAGLPIATAQ